MYENNLLRLSQPIELDRYFYVNPLYAFKEQAKVSYKEILDALEEYSKFNPNAKAIISRIKIYGIQ